MDLKYTEHCIVTFSVTIKYSTIGLSYHGLQTSHGLQAKVFKYLDDWKEIERRILFGVTCENLHKIQLSMSTN